MSPTQEEVVRRGGASSSGVLLLRRVVLVTSLRPFVPNPEVRNVDEADVTPRASHRPVDSNAAEAFRVGGGDPCRRQDADGDAADDRLPRPWFDIESSDACDS